MRWIVSLLVLCLAAAQAPAAETRTAPEGYVPPPATVAQLDWLAGIWTGEGIGGAPATEVYSPPGVTSTDPFWKSLPLMSPSIPSCAASARSVR